jgi:hypothetical protein
MPFYQEVLDRLASRSAAELVLLKNLCIAVDVEQKSRIGVLVRELTNTTRSDGLHFRRFSEDLFYELLIRIVFLGLMKPFRELRSWYIKGNQLKWDVFDQKKYLWDEIVERALADKLGGRGDLGGQAVRAWRTRFRTMQGLLIDLGVLKKIPYKPQDPAQIAPAVLARHYQTLTSENLYFMRLNDLIGEVIGGMQAAIQVMLDRATTDLENGKGGAKLRKLGARLRAQRKLFEKSNPETGILVERFTIVRSIGQKHRGRYLDAFLQGKTGRRRSIEYMHYNQDDDYSAAEERKVSLLEIMRIRDEQVDLLTTLYGEERDVKTGKPTYDAKRRKHIIDTKLNGKLRLRSDDDWVRYLAEAFQAGGSNDKDATNAAWEALIKDLWRYMNVFTGQPKYDLLGSSYLDVKFEFPRNLTGQLLHDCGVYAVRLSYIISRFGQRVDAHRTASERFHLDLHFIVLPNHVGLIIKGKNLTTLITHNSDFTRASEDEVKDIQSKWENRDEQGNVRTAPVPIDEEQFWAELAAPWFLEGVNVPYALLPIPKPGKSAGAARKVIWDAFLRLVTGRAGRLFSGETGRKNTPIYQFHLRYLDVQLKENEWYNQQVVKTWNKHWYKAWQDRGKELTDAFNALGKARPIPKNKTAQKNRFRSLRDDYVKHLEEPFKKEFVIVAGGKKKKVDKFEKARQPVLDAKRKLNSDLAANPRVLKPGVRHTWEARLDIGGRGRLKDVKDYINGISGPVDNVRFDPPWFTTLLIPAPE